MFGFVRANLSELTKEQKLRYNAVYCGICRRIREQTSRTARLTLQYDMAFLALLHTSLYEPPEQTGKRACALHPVKPKPWIDNDAIRYAADMNVALAYYKCLDDWQDDRSASAHLLAKHLEGTIPALLQRYPRQMDAMERCISRLSQLEGENCPNPDEPANCFGELMGELLVWKEDLWTQDLRQMGVALGRFIYLADAVADYEKDRRKHRYNPLSPENRDRWEEYLILAMGRCTTFFEKLPLVQDKEILDNILYSGVWTGTKGEKQEEIHDRGSV